MTDDELIELIESKTPEELSVDEIDELRLRLPVSAKLQDALAGRLEMEQYLTNVLGEIQLDVDKILARASQEPDKKPRSPLALWGWVASVLLVGAIVTWLVVRSRPHGGIQEIANAENRVPGENDHLAGDKSAPKDSAAEQLAKLQVPRAKVVDPAEIAAMSASDPKGTLAELAKRDPWEPEVPWAEQPVPGPESLFEELDQKTPAPLEAELRRWFADVQGKPKSIGTTSISLENWGWFDGLMKLKAPWIEGVSFRIASTDFNNLRIHFWSGSEGVTLSLADVTGRQWSGYATSRKDNNPRPTEYLLTSRDEGRFWRTNLTSPVCLELRYEHGKVTLSRGDVHLLSVPLARQPDEVYFDGRAAVRYLAMVKSAPLPPEPVQNPIVRDVPGPAELVWNEKLAEGFKVTKHSDGSLELTGKASQGVATIWTQLPVLGMSDLILELDSVTARTGLFFGNAEGKPTSTIGFAKDNRLGLLGIGKAVSVGQWISDQDIESNTLGPYVRSKLLVKMSIAGGATRVATSVDGVHWGRPFSPFWGDHGRTYVTLGLYCQGGQAATSIKLKRMTYRAPQLLMALAAPELLEKVPQQAGTIEYGPWLQAVYETRPVGVELAAWRKACALATLARGTWATLGNSILEGLIDEALADIDDPAKRLQLLDEAFPFVCVMEDTSLALRWLRKYEQVGWRAYQQGESRPFSLVVPRELSAPLGTRLPFTWFPDSLARAEILELIYQQRWDELVDVGEHLQMWRRQSYPRGAMLHDWANVLASRGLAVTTEPDPDSFRSKPKKINWRQRKYRPPVITMQSDWRHPLVTELSKEGFNVLAEFDAALGGKLYKDACQIISGTPGSDMLGLLPNNKDPQLLTSLSGAVTLAMREDTALATTMVEEFGPIGLLRIRQAIRDGDAAALEAATLQFYGTPAAGEAHLWLGDRALAAGAVAHALGQYRQARRSASADLQARIAASEQLALAMTGQPSGEDITESIVFGQTKLTSNELKAMLDDLRQHHAADALGNLKANQVAATQCAPAPVGFKTTVRGPFDGDQGQSPQSVPGALTEFDVDWFSRQLATVVVGDRMIVSNRFQVAAYDLNERRWLWRTGLQKEQGSAHEWSLTPMSPLVTSTRIFVRRLTRSGPSLAAVNSSTGKVIWSTKTESDRSVVSDPLLVQDELFALVMARVDQEYLLSLCTYDPDTGTQLTERRVAHFRDLWHENRTCEAVAAGDHFIVVCGGSVLSFDLTGKPQWVRRQLLVPAALDRSSVKQRHDLPLLAEGRLYVTQPGVREVVCLDPETGGLNWRRTIPDIQAMLGVESGRLLVRTDQGLIALDVSNGTTLWNYADRHLHDGTLLGGPGGLLVTRCTPGVGEDRVAPELVWIDPATGHPTSMVALDTLKQKRPRIGTLVSHSNKIWAFVRSAAGEQRDIVELEPQPDQEVRTPSARDQNYWTSQLPTPLLAAMDQLFPGWTLLDGRADAKTGVEAEFNGEKNVLSILGRPSAIVRQVQLPAGKPKLILRVGHHPQGRWKLEVRVNGDQLLSETIESKTTQNCWRNCEVDLSPYAGREVNLLLRGLDDGNQPYQKWKRIEIE